MYFCVSHDDFRLKRVESDSQSITICIPPTDSCDNESHKVTTESYNTYIFAFHPMISSLNILKLFSIISQSITVLHSTSMIHVIRSQGKSRQSHIIVTISRPTQWFQTKTFTSDSHSILNRLPFWIPPNGSCVGVGGLPSSVLLSLLLLLPCCCRCRYCCCCCCYCCCYCFADS